VFGLAEGKHNLKIVVSGEKRQESTGKCLYITKALVFRTALKQNRNHRFTFEN
jgi:hypothetical protein